jgi:hypothetical protein
MMHTIEEGMIHRDLAAPNVLVFAVDDDAANASRVLVDYLVKSADYGLTKDASAYY